MAQGNRWTAIRAHNFVLVNSLGVLPSQSQYETQLRQVVKAEERESPLSHLLSSNPPDDGVETVLVTLLSLPPFSKSPLFPFLMFLLNLEKTWREKAASTKHTTAALKCKSQWQWSLRANSFYVFWYVLQGHHTRNTPKKGAWKCCTREQNSSQLFLAIFLTALGKYWVVSSVSFSRCQTQKFPQAHERHTTSSEPPFAWIEKGALLHLRRSLIWTKVWKISDSS